MHPIEVTDVWKRYRLGSKQDSLRDAIPALVHRLMGRDGAPEEVRAGEFLALRDVSFHVRRGETLGVIGSNGAGKSTMLKLLSRITRQTKGAIVVRGRLAALIEVGAGFHPDLSGRENIYLNGTIMGLRHKEITRMFDSIVAFSELERFLNMPVKRYSSGMGVRLGFAVAAHVNPDILLIDEVLAVGDLSFQQKCFQRILELKAQGTTIIFVSHNLEAVKRICDRVMLLREGRVMVDGDPTRAIAEYHQDTFRKYRFEKVWTPLGAELTDTSRDIEFVEAQLLDEAGMPQDRFQVGQPFQVSLAYRAKRTIRSPSMTVTIERVDGHVCHEASTEASGLRWEGWEGDGALTLSYPSPNLSPNSYLLSAVIYEGHNPSGVARMSGPLYFQIVSDRASRGAVQLAHQWNTGPVATNGSSSASAMVGN